MLALRRLSREWDEDPYVQMLLRAQKFTAGIKFSDYKSALKQLIQCNAFLDPSEGKLKF